MIKQKKAALTTRQIVILTILIISFIIILFLIFRLNLQGEGDKQICHSSVLQRGSSILSLTGIIPLNCKIHYLCISATSDCNKSRMSNPDDILKVEGKEEVFKILSDEMADCWWMYGEGEIDYLGEKDLSQNIYCSLCTLFVFDDSIEKFFPDGRVKELELFNYMIETEHSSGMNYYEYIKGQKITDQIKSIKKVDEETKEVVDEGTEEIKFREFDIAKKYYIAMGISSKTYPLVSIFVGAAVVAIGAAITVATAGVATPIYVGALVVGSAVGGGGGYLIGTYIEGGSGNQFVTPTIVEVGSEDYKGLECVDVKSIS